MIGQQAYKAPITIEEIRLARKKRLVIAMLSIFGDESSDEKEQRTYTVSGIAGTQEDWDKLAPLWKERTGGIPFHGAECEAGKGPYKKMEKRDRLQLYADLVKILSRSRLMGFAATIDLQGFKSCFPHILPSEPYHLCFRKVLTYFAFMGYILIPQEKVRFTFDLNSKIQYSTVKLFEWVKGISEKEWKYSITVDEIAFASRKDEAGIGIQAADIIAREAMKHYDNFFAGPKKYEKMRQSLQILRAPNYKFEFFVKEYFEDMKNKLFKDFEEKTSSLYNSYENWRIRNKRDDNATNRFEFLIYFDSLAETK